MEGGYSVDEALSALPCLLKTTQPNRCNPTAKKAETLYLNLTDLCERRGIERIGFHTLTFVENVKSRFEAQKRFNSYATHYLRHVVTDYIATVERQQRGAIHYHLLVAFPFDIRSGFDFAAARSASAAHKVGDREAQRRFMSDVIRSANDNLRRFWNDQRDAAKRYGFGRCETLPVLSNTAAVSRYVGGYVASEWENRLPEDKGLRTIRYGLEHRAASIRWAWAKGGGEIWRRGCRVLSAVLGTSEFGTTLGNRWGYNWGKEIMAYGRHWEKCLAFCERTLSDEDDLSARFEFCARMAETIWEHENKRLSAPVTPSCVHGGGLGEQQKGQ